MPPMTKISPVGCLVVLLFLLRLTADLLYKVYCNCPNWPILEGQLTPGFHRSFSKEPVCRM